MGKYAKRADGRYATNILIGYDENGKRKQKTLYGKTIRELEAKVAEFKSLQAKGIVVGDKGITLEDWLDEWLKTYKSGLSDNVREQYWCCIKNHIKPYPVAKKRLSVIRPCDLQFILNKPIEKKTYSVANLMLKILRQALRAAITNDLIYKDITTSLKIPQNKTAPGRAMTDEEKAAMNAAIFTPQQKAFIYIGRYAGLRRGEILALNKSDINLQANTISVHKNLVLPYRGYGTIKSSPKSAAGNRRLPICAVLHSVLVECLNELPEFLFESSDGKMFTRSYMNTHWKSTLIAMGLKDAPPVQNVRFTPHVLRHEFASSLYKAGIDIKTAQKLLGHSNISMTLAVYTHFAQDDKDVIAKLDALNDM